MSQSCFSLGFLSQNSLWKLSTFHGYKGYLYWSENGMRRVSFSKTELAGDLALWLDWVASSSCELIEWLVWTFCLVVLQLARWFSFSTCFTRVHLLAAYQSRATREIQSRVSTSLHNLEHFFAQSWAFLRTILSISSHTTLTWFPPKCKVFTCWITSKFGTE